MGMFVYQFYVDLRFFFFISEVMRKTDRDLKKTQRGLTRDQARLEKEEKRLVSQD